MNIIALLALMATGLTGTLLVATWLGMGGDRAESSHPGRFPNALVLCHVSAAIAVFLLWLFFVVLQTTAVALTAAVLLFVAVVLGLGLFRRWRVQLHDPAAAETAERELGVAAVAVHGAFATATAVLVVLAVTRL